MTHWKRPWCWEGLGAGGEGDNRGGDGWMALPTQWTWVWVDSGGWRWTGRPGVLRFMGSQSWTWLSDWTEPNWIFHCIYHNFFIHLPVDGHHLKIGLFLLMLSCRNWVYTLDINPWQVNLLLQGTFPTQGLYPGLLHRMVGSFPLSHKGNLLRFSGHLRKYRWGDWNKYFASY